MKLELTSLESGRPLICFALEQEAKPFRRAARVSPMGEILVTGMGEKNSQASLRAWLERRRPAFVLTCGVAGGLNPELKTGDVVFQTETPRLAAALNTAGAREGSFVMSARIASTAEQKRALRQTSGADAVEMESGVIVRECRARGLPVAIVRSILDTAEEDLPLDFNKFLTADSRMDYGRLVLGAAMKPLKIPDLIKLGARSAEAAGALARVLQPALQEMARAAS